MKPRYNAPTYNIFLPIKYARSICIVIYLLAIMKTLLSIIFISRLKCATAGFNCKWALEDTFSDGPNQFFFDHPLLNAFVGLEPQIRPFEETQEFRNPGKRSDQLLKCIGTRMTTFNPTWSHLWGRDLSWQISNGSQVKAISLYPLIHLTVWNQIECKN